MGISASLILGAVGAVLIWAVNLKNPNGFNINTVGIILLVVAGIGLLLSLLFWSSWGGFGGYRRVEPGVERETVIRE